MKTFISIALLGVVSALSDLESHFMTFVTEFGKSYNTLDEYNFRLSQFARNHGHIMAHNANEGVSFLLGHNQMSDWTMEEYTAILTHTEMPEEDKNYMYHPETEELAASTGIDWRNHNRKSYVNSIKDQGQCGSCWSFSANAALENAWAVKHGHLYSFAEQELVDCDPHSHGCNGGLQSYAYNYYKKHFAAEEKNYSYTAKDGQCAYDTAKHTEVKTTGYINVSKNSPTQMKAALEKGVLAVSIEADQRVFQSYKSGIFDSTECGSRLDHATNVVGWGSTGGTEYWIMRNSWGKTWGEKGYMRVKQVSGKGICGIQKEPLYPTV